ncbi:hypothetical protein F2Q69_00014057 [Brassica cretica]|uniref:Uncharacterized protein n=1 Tax=Brassica cretica TaxID=69181 RepID=A0A8S9R740_BRACR|nr:hypothetical protein F2Q69_00014057 [Brassica cretica]
MEITFRKSVHADFYGYLDDNFIVSVCVDWSVRGPVATLRPDTCGLVATLRPGPCLDRSQRCGLICVDRSRHCVAGRNVAT